MRPQSLQEIQLVYSQVEALMPDSPMLKGWNSYAQCDEDGIIRECLQRIARIAEPSKTFIEIGCGNGLENNSHQLLLDGYRGCWVDGDSNNIQHIESSIGQVDPKRLTVLREFITRDNIKHLIAHFRDVLDTEQVDFFSLDTDGNDLVLVKDALEVISPKLVCVEYNGKFPPPTRLAIDYNPDHHWANDDYYGATLQSWVDALPGYTLISCNLSGVNAFFVRDDLMQEFKSYPIESVFQPARYWLIGIWGHVHSMKWLKQTLAAPAFP
ncbi:hypothetical protein [Paraburkholderia hospita]|uniref:hypothetical protein n=1 Tax=Paraburkholderia hospita TaxID=169430 RepID=UPI00103F1F57|nr:hypothetical protein [Paraburkholderia hospita]